MFDRPTRLFLAVGLNVAGWSFSFAQNTFPNPGNVGIGTTAPSTKLQVVETLSDVAQQEAFNVEQGSATTTTATQYIKGVDIEKYWYNIPAEVTSNGYQIGLASQVFVSDSNFRGTIASQYGIWTRTGINIAGSEGPRRINNAYGIYVEGLNTVGTVDNHYGVFQTGSGTKNYFAGNVGVGTSAPIQKLSVSGANGLPASSGNSADGIVRMGSSVTNLVLDFGVSGGGGAVTWLQARSQATYAETYPLSLNPNGGNVGIGTTSPAHKLAVNGTVRAKEIIVDSGWADHVFADDYRLAPLDEVEAHIRANKRLPNIPSAQEIESNGLPLASVSTSMMAKIEELTLYVIELKKQNDALARRMEELEEGERNAD